MLESHVPYIPIDTGNIEKAESSSPVISLGNSTPKKLRAFNAAPDILITLAPKETQFPILTPMPRRRGDRMGDRVILLPD